MIFRDQFDVDDEYEHMDVGAMMLGKLIQINRNERIAGNKTKTQ